MKRKGFTLVELLVVIAIITILAGMLMPALNRARQEARKAKCTSNVKNVGYQFQMYRNNNRDRMPSWNRTSPFATNPTGGTSNFVVYDSSLSLALLYPHYAETLDLFICPSTDDTPEFADEDEDATTLTGGQNFDIDGDLTTTDLRFNVDNPLVSYYRSAAYSNPNDPSYVIDPNIPVNCWASRPIYADGPDLDLVKMLWMDATSATDETTFPGDEHANHGYGAVVAFADGSADFVLMTGNAELRNPRLDPASHFGDNQDGDSLGIGDVTPDIYADDAFDYVDLDTPSNSRYDGDEKFDAHLGTHVDFGTYDPGSGSGTWTDGAYWDDATRDWDAEGRPIYTPGSVAWYGPNSFNSDPESAYNVDDVED